MRSGAVALVFAVVLMLIAAAPASAITQKQAGKKAVAALGSKKASGAVVVLGLPKPLRSGTRVTQEGGKKVFARVGRERAYFFYQDAAPLQPFPHAGRVALVGAKSGKVKLTRQLTRRPLLNGRLPAFLKSVRAYSNDDYVVYANSATLGNDDPSPAAGPEAAALEPFAIDIPGVNQPPEGDDQIVVAKQDSPKHIVLTGSDPDPDPDGDNDGDQLTFRISKPPNHGVLTGQPPFVTYTPNPGRLGPDHFFFIISDGELESKEAKVTINVVPRGAAPVVTTSAGCTEYFEQTPAVAVDGGLTVSDADDTVLDSAVVQVTTNFERGDDLVFTDQNGITGSYDDITGTLQLVGTASLATYEAALRSVRFRNLSSGTPAATKDIVFTVNDAGGDSAPATKQVCITEAGGPNNRPVIGTSEGALSYIENDGAVPIDPGFFVIDPDSTQLSGATVKFVESQPPEDDEGNPIGDPVNNFAPAEDELGFTDQNGITGEYDDTTGVMTLSGLASVAHYEAAIRSVTYENESEDPSDATRSIRFQVTDASGLNSAPASYGILVTPVNDAPTAATSEGASSYTEDEPASPVDAGLVVDDVDDDNLEGARVRIASGLQAGDELGFEDQLGIIGTYDVESATLLLSGSAPVADYQTALRAVTFRHVGDDPDPSRSVEIIVNDGELDSDAAFKEIAVTPVNDAPVVTTTDGSTPYTENEPSVVVDAGVAVGDVDDDNLESAQVSVSDFESGDELQLDEESLTGIAVDFNGSTGVLTLTGQAPVADYEAALRAVRYQHTGQNPSTSKSIEFVVNDGEDDSNAATKAIAVTPVNDPPIVSVSDGSTVYEIGGPGVVVDSGLTVGDPDDTLLESGTVAISGFEPGDELVFTDQAGIAGVYNTGTGVLALTTETTDVTVEDWQTALQSIEFRTTNEAPSPSRQIEFTVSDGEASSATVSKTVDLVEPNDPPVVTTSEGNSSYTLGDTTGAEIDNQLTVTDTDGTDLQGAVVRIQDIQPGDELLFTNQGGISGTIDETGFLILSGPATLAAYETALRSVKFRNTVVTAPGTRTIEFQVNDGEDDSAVALKGVDLVAPPPPAPPPE